MTLTRFAPIAIVAACSPAPIDIGATLESSGTSAASTTTLETTGASSSSTTLAESSSNETSVGDDGLPPVCPLPPNGPWDDCFSPWPGTCDVYAQDCEAGEKCTYFLPEGAADPYAFETRCVPIVDTPVSSGEPCTSDGVYTGIDDCDATSFCVGMRPRAEVGTCIERARCGESCTTVASFAFRSGQPAYCAQRCDPLSSEDVCPTGLACQPPLGGYDAFNLVVPFVCQPDMTWWFGDATDCSGTTCATGSICGNWSTESSDLRCYAMCATSDPTTCGEGETCRPWSNVAGEPCSPGEVGSCVAP